MDCRVIAFPNLNIMWSWTQIHWIASFETIHCIPWNHPLQTLKAEMWSTHQKIFYLTHSFWQYKHEISLMETFIFQGKFTDADFKFLSLLLFNKIIRMSLWQFHLIMTFLDEHLDDKRWQFSTKVELIGTAIFSKIYKIQCSMPLWATLVRIPNISRHFSLEYCSLAQHQFSVVKSLSEGLDFSF